MFLTPDQVQTLTGFKRPAKQREALRQMRIRHYVRPDGRPMVIESDLEVSHRERQASPDFEAI
jgi:hypothetical protein